MSDRNLDTLWMTGFVRYDHPMSLRTIATTEREKDEFADSFAAGILVDERFDGSFYDIQTEVKPKSST